MGYNYGNLFALNGNGGRPPLYETPEQMHAKIVEYLETCKPYLIGDQVIQNPPTVTGLALYLGFAQRKSLLDYKGKDEFCNLIKRAITCIESAYEQRLTMSNPTGAIFALKNMGWSDRQEIDQINRGDMAIRVIYEDDKPIEDK